VNAAKLVDGGDHRTIPGEEDEPCARPRYAIRSEGDAKVMRAELEQSRDGGDGKPRRHAPVTEEGQGGSGKGQRPATDADVGDTGFARNEDARTLNTPPTP